MAQLIRLHDLACTIGVSVIMFVTVGLVAVGVNKLRCRVIYAAHQIEIM